MTQLIIFTDLDGTLLDSSTYSFKPAVPALNAVRKYRIPLVFCSSKTRKEIIFWRQFVGNGEPFISENGGGIFIPAGYFGEQSLPAELDIIDEGGFQVIRLGAPYRNLRKALLQLRSEGFDLTGFGDMSVSEVAGSTGLDDAMAALAKARDFDEPFLFGGSDDAFRRLEYAVHLTGLSITKGRFYHLLGDSDKGRAVDLLSRFFRQKFDEIITVALGDSPNDISMLSRVDYPILVRKPDGSYDPLMEVPGLVKAGGIGPEGWNEEVMRFVSEYFKTPG
jgi:mannosyl-3-phosphoglycerate phosphatase family protein